MHQRTFTLEDQNAFAKFSGDNNPMHVDPVAARRLLFGAPVVHGIHLFLWALDCCLAHQTEKIEITSVKAGFPKPIRVGDEAFFQFQDLGDKKVRFELINHQAVVTKIDIEWKVSGPGTADVLIKKRFHDLSAPRNLSQDDIKDRTGVLDLCFDPETSGRLFPHVTRCVSPTQIAAFIATTFLVGVECPGLHSVYSELTLSKDEAMNTAGLEYQVAKCERRMVFMNIKVPGMKGMVRSILRPEPREQISYVQLQESVERSEFSGQRALIIGGSRGLGETTAKLLAAGGADVRITYHKGGEDAERVVEEITSGGGSAGSYGLNVLDEQIKMTDIFSNGWTPTHLYYFATPFIGMGTKKFFSSSLFQNFCNYYVIRFQSIVEQLIPLGLKGVYYPSSVFVDEMPLDMGEYAVAKLAGEASCAYLEKKYPEITVHKPRLPKMATDQTHSIMPERNPDPESVMLEHARKLRNESNQKTSVT